jgi:hypothetical protein
VRWARVNGCAFFAQVPAANCSAGAPHNLKAIQCCELCAVVACRYRQVHAAARQPDTTLQALLHIVSHSFKHGCVLRFCPTFQLFCRARLTCTPATRTASLRAYLMSVSLWACVWGWTAPPTCTTYCSWSAQVSAQHAGRTKRLVLVKYFAVVHCGWLAATQCVQLLGSVAIVQGAQRPCLVSVSLWVCMWGW